ncbi:MAG: NDP-sugar synthase [Acidimicrobiales bacterium]|nr:NDP-sugar synthase [Acidimicrobiales bacterium]
MRAIVLVGGFGTRLRPLTWHTPKQMLPVVDRPMLERVVSELGQHGVTDAILSLGFKPDAFLAAYPDDRCGGVRLHYAVEPEPLDTAGAVRFAAEAVGMDSTFIVVNGDVLTDLDITALWRLHRDKRAEGTIALTPVEDPSRYGVVPIDDDGRVEAFIEKPRREDAPSNWINAGTYVLEPSVIERIPPGRRVSIERETFPAMVADGTLYALHSEAYWVDAGTAETYLQVQLDYVDGHRGVREPAIDASACVAADAVVEHSVVMAGAQVGAGATVRDSALLPGVRVDAGAVVERSVCGPRSVVGAGATLRDLTVLGEDVAVPAGAELWGARIPDEEP